MMTKQTTTTTTTSIYVGLDVAKLTLQGDLQGKALAVANTPAGHRSLLTHMQRLHTKTSRRVADGLRRRRRLRASIRGGQAPARKAL